VIDKEKFNYDNLSLGFKEGETEVEFQEFSYSHDSQSLKILSIGIIVCNILFIATDWTRSGDLMGTLIFRIGLSCFMLLGVLNSRLVKDKDSEKLQLLVFLIDFGLVVSFFLAHYFLDMPDYSLPNAIFTLMLLTVLFSGLRFRISMGYSLIVYALYVVFSTMLFYNHFWISQINNLTINLLVILAGAYMMEKFKRNIFVTNHIIEHQKKDLVSSNELKRNLLSILSHDLRAPMSKLITILNLWRGKNITKDELVDFTQKIELEVEKTSSLMDNLLYWSRDLLKGDQGKFMDVNVYEVIQQNISLHSDKLLSKKIRCQNLADPRKMVCLDVNTLNLCLRNMISNAIKFTPAMGLVEIGFNKEDGFAMFFVSDSGVGISKHGQEQLFGLSFDSMNGTRGEQGSGMGLHIVKEFLDKVGGSIRCESKPGRGSTFVFSLPIQKNNIRVYEEDGALDSNF